MNKLATFFRESSAGRFLIPLGLILIVFSFFTFKAVDHAKDFIKTEATVTKAELYEQAYNKNHQPEWGSYILVHEG